MWDARTKPGPGVGEVVQSLEGVDPREDESDGNLGLDTETRSEGTASG